MEEVQELMESLSSQLRSFLKEYNDAPAFKDQILAFAYAVDWSEPWIISLLSFHGLLLLVVLLTRKQETLQFVIFIAGVMAVWSAENVNALAATHWKAFSRQNYFDSSGLFITVLYSGPLMVICMVILVQLMLNVLQAMFKWKRAELRHRARAAARSAAEQQEKKEE